MIGVFGATGTNGRELVRALKERNPDFKCIIRDPAAAKDKLGDDVALVQGDLGDTASLDAALAGVDTLFLLCGHGATIGDLQINAIEAAKRAGVAYVVHFSGTDKGIRADGGSPVFRDLHRVEEALKASGLRWTILRPNFFMQNLLMNAPAVAAESKFVTPLPPSTTITMIDARDNGDCAAAVLTGSGHDGQTYFLTGRPITMGGVAEELSRLLDREVSYVQPPPEAGRKAMNESGMPRLADRASDRCHGSRGPRRHGRRDRRRAPALGPRATRHQGLPHRLSAGIWGLIQTGRPVGGGPVCGPELNDYLIGR